MNPVLKNAGKLVSSLRIFANSSRNKNQIRCLSMTASKFQNVAVTEDFEAKYQSAATFTDLPEEHQMLKDMCRQFAETELWPIAGEIDK